MNISLLSSIAEIAEELSAKQKTLSGTGLVERLEKKGFSFMGEPSIIAYQLIRNAAVIAASINDDELVVAITSSFTDDEGWPLLIETEKEVAL